MVSKFPPLNEQPPECQCGCGNPVKWNKNKGWSPRKIGHYHRTEETLKLLSKNSRASRRGKRKRDLYPTVNRYVYGTIEYREAREKLVVGRPCLECGTTKNVQAHHQTPGDDSSLIPLCRSCHTWTHKRTGTTPKKRYPPEGEATPLCKCGCGIEVKWRPHEGWYKFAHGHGRALVPASVRHQKAPLCGCGCGKKTNYKGAYGWNEYLRGHRPSKEHSPPGEIPPLCRCGCGEPVNWKRWGGWYEFKRGHHTKEMKGGPRVEGHYKQKRK